MSRPALVKKPTTIAVSAPATLPCQKVEMKTGPIIAALLAEEQVLAYEFSGRRHDCGSKLGYLIATVEYGLRHPELGDRFRDYLHAFGCRFDGLTPVGD